MQIQCALHWLILQKLWHGLVSQGVKLYIFPHHIELEMKIKLFCTVELEIKAKAADRCHDADSFSELYRVARQANGIWKGQYQEQTYDLWLGCITKYTGHHVLVSRQSLDNWIRLTRTFLEICPRKGYATRQTSSWPALHNLLALSPIMILTCFVSPFWKWKGLMELNKAACECVSMCVRKLEWERGCVCVFVWLTDTYREKIWMTVCYSLMRSWSVIPEGGGPIWVLLGLIELCAGRCVSAFSLLRTFGST